MKNKESRNLEDYSNRKRLLSTNRKLANIKVYTVVILLLYIFIIGGVNALISYFKNPLFPQGEISFENTLVFHEDSKLLYFIISLIFVVGYVKLWIEVKMAYSSANIGQKGTSRATERKELDEQFRRIPDRGERFYGKGGIPIARDGKFLYIDDTPVNNLIIGISRSGKGEMVVFPLIDIYSRAEKQASMIITDPKLELAQASIPRLTELGYECHILNLIDPEFSMGYNPLTLIIEEYKNGDEAAAEQLCRAFCYSIYSASEQSGDKFWSDNSTSLLTALILASIEDNLKADAEENAKRLKKFKDEEEKRLKNIIRSLPNETRKAYLLQRDFDELKKDLSMTDEDIITELTFKYKEEEQFVRDTVISQRIDIGFKKREFVKTFENEKKINLYSIISTFTILANAKVDQNTTELDKYFFDRPGNNKAKIIYGSIGISGDKTKGSIYSSMLTGLNVFTQTNIAKMTAKSTFDINKVGFGGKPIAIFIGIPDYDRSNHFIASVFIKQLYYTLAKLATATASGKCLREVIFILDEFGNMPAIEDMDNIITVCLGRNIRFNLIIQAYSQVAKLYGDTNSKTITGNCGNHLYILTSDPDTADEFARRLGTETITDITKSGTTFSLNKQITESQIDRKLITGEELMTLKPGEMVVSRIMKRDTLDGKSVRPRPIFNLGEYRMLYRYEYLLDYFPSGQQLYTSPIIDRVNNLIKEAENELKEVVSSNEYYKPKVKFSSESITTKINKKVKKEISEISKKSQADKSKQKEEERLKRIDFKVENTKNILLAERIFDAEKYLEDKNKIKQAAVELMTDKQLERVANLLNLTLEERESLKIGEIRMIDLEFSFKSAMRKGYKDIGYKGLELIKECMNPNSRIKETNSEDEEFKKIVLQQQAIRKLEEKERRSKKEKPTNETVIGGNLVDVMQSNNRSNKVYKTPNNKSSIKIAKPKTQGKYQAPIKRRK